MNKIKRTPSKEAQEVVKKNEYLQNIFRDKTIPSGTGDHRGFMYLSRYKDEADTIDALQKEAESNDKVVESFSVAKNVSDDVVTTTVVASEPTAVTHNIEQKRKYAMSLATLAKKEDKRILIVDEGAIPVLIELAALSDNTIQIRCASALSHLAKEPRLRARMLNEGVLLSLLNLASSSNILEVKVDCCRSICNLSCEPGYESRMVKEGVTAVLQHFAHMGQDCYEIALKILLNLSCVDEKYPRIEEVTDMLMTLSNSQFLTAEHDVLILSTFCNLSALRNNQLRLVEDGAMKIVEKYYRSECEAHRVMACELMKNLTTDSRTRTKLLELNVLPILLNMAIDTNEQIKLSIVKAFLHLSKDRIFRERIVNGDTIEFLISNSLGCSDNLEMERAYAKTLRVLCGDQEITHRLIKTGMGPALLKLLDSRDLLVPQFCLESVCRLLQMKEVMKVLVELNAITAIVSLANRNKLKLTSEWCAYAVYHLVIFKMCTGSQLEDIVLPCVIQLCKDSTSLTKSYCSATISFLTNLKTVDCSGAIPLLIEMLKHGDNQNIKKFCAMSLFNLADTDEKCQLILESEALDPVVQLTQSEHIQTKVVCAGIISRLSLHKAYYNQFASGNVLKVLLELSCVDHRLTQRRVVIALSNLSQDQGLRSQLLALNPIPYINSLASERDEYLRRGCMSIVCNMSYIPGSEKVIVNAGIVPTLMITSLITSDQLASKIICVKALVNLMADRSLYSSMVKDGVVWGLSKLAQIENSEMVLLCSKALCCLSCDYAKDIIESSVAVRTVMKLVESLNLELKKIGARTLTNILLKTSDDEFRKFAVEHMKPLAQFNDPELNEICVLCLCLASQSESCRETIVQTGMLQMIDATTIFADKRISYAYITMFSNIANNPMMRTKVLDDRAIERFEKICSAKDPELALSVARALYCVSCSNENIPKLVDQKIVPFINSLLNMHEDRIEEEEEYEEKQVSPEIFSHLFACLYNLTTNEKVQSHLVSQGFVHVINTMWSEIEVSPTMIKLAYLSICHLACGKSNSSRMISDGCASILCYITESGDDNLFNTLFNADLKFRCSAALRNLLCVQANHSDLIAHGCLNTLIKLSMESSTMRTALHEPMRNNTAAAIKLLTYNEAMRPHLLQCEAIDIILEHIRLEKVDMAIGPGLLKEMEAESWNNGARGKQKDGRSPRIPPSRLFTDLLQGMTNVQLNVSLHYATLDKFYVQVNLAEQNVMEEKMMMSEAAAQNPDAEVEEEELHMDDLSNQEDVDETIATQIKAYNKQDCEVGSIDVVHLNFLRTDSFASISCDETERDKRELEVPSTTSYSFSLPSNGGGTVGSNVGSDSSNIQSALQQAATSLQSSNYSSTGGNGQTRSRSNSNSNSNSYNQSKNESHRSHHSQNRSQYSDQNLEGQYSIQTPHSAPSRSSYQMPEISKSSVTSHTTSSNRQDRRKSFTRSSGDFSSSANERQGSRSSLSILVSRSRSRSIDISRSNSMEIKLASAKSPTDLDKQFEKKFNKFALPNLFMAVAGQRERQKISKQKTGLPRLNSSSSYNFKSPSVKKSPKKALSKSTTAIPKRKKLNKEEKELQEMLGLIKAAKKEGTQEAVGNVVGKWRQISTF